MLCSPTHSVHGLHGSVALTTSEKVTPEDRGMGGMGVGKPHPEFSRLPLGHLGRWRPSRPHPWSPSAHLFPSCPPLLPPIPDSGCGKAAKEKGSQEPHAPAPETLALKSQGVTQLVPVNFLADSLQILSESSQHD